MVLVQVDVLLEQLLREILITRSMLIHASVVVLVQVHALLVLFQRLSIHTNFLLPDLEDTYPGRAAFSMEVIMEARVNKDMIIVDMLQIDPGIAPILMASGMHCIGCPSAQGESLEQAAMVHGLDADELVTAVNNYLEKK